MIVFDDEINESLANIAKTRDGRVLHIFLQKAVMALAPDPMSGALQVFEGGRRFAQQIKAVMDVSIAENSSGGTKSEQLVVIVPRGAVSVAGTRGARRRVSPDPDASTES